jgi:hypothetical protein
MAAAVPSKLSAVLIDLSGTLHIGKTALPGAAAALSRLRQAGLKARGAAHTTKHSITDRAPQSSLTDWDFTTSLACAQVRFVTNTTKESAARVVHNVQDLGFDIQQHEVRAVLCCAGLPLLCA